MGRISARAAAGKRAPLFTTSDRKAGPSPGRGATLLTFRKMATTVGRPDRRAIVTHVRGRRSSLRSSTRNTVAPTGELEEHPLERRPLEHELAYAHATPHQLAGELLRQQAVEVDDQPVGQVLAHREARHGPDHVDGAMHVGRLDEDALGGRE